MGSTGSDFLIIEESGAVSGGRDALLLNDCVFPEPSLIGKLLD